MRKSTLAVFTAGSAIALSAALAPPPVQASARAEAPSQVARAVEALVTGGADAAAAAIPDDFADVAGYRPVTDGAMLINPNGQCSSPVPLPAEFDGACRGHDLGYDLLRYADRTGTPLGGWARRSLDRQLGQRMHDACTTRPDDLTRASCGVVADAAVAAVQANSWRQGFGVPVREPVGPIAAGVGGAALLGAALAAAHRRRGRAHAAAAPVLAGASRAVRA
ncbi:hypothetical protein ACWF62_05210 [Rhodococcus sp. NPDC054953]